VKSLGDKEALGCGAVLAAGDLETAKRRRQALAVTPAQMTDPLTRAVLQLADDLLSRNELPSAATVFVEGGSRNLFDARDRERLREWQVHDALTEGELVTIGRTLHRDAQNRRVGDMLMALGAAIKSGKSKKGDPFGYAEGRSWFDQIGADYERSYATGIRGPDAVRLTRARAEERWKQGKTNYLLSGMPAFDKLFGGWPRQLCNVLGHAGKGKSTFLATQLGLHASMGFKPVLFVTEDDFTAPVERHVSLRLGVKRRDVYSKPFDDDAKAREVEEQLAKEWEGLAIYTRRDGSTVEDVLRIFTAHVIEDDSQVFMLDNVTGLTHSLQGRQDSIHDAAARGLNRMQEWTERWNRTLIVASHTNNAYWNHTKGRAYPEMADTADTGGASNAARYYRFGVGVWQVGESLRLTNIKNNIEGKLEAERATVAFDAHVDQGLVDVDSGREVNLREEARLEREAKDRNSKARKDEEARRVKERNDRWKAEEKAKREKELAEAKAKEPAQGELLHVENPKERR
jgi:hypothetical protein